MDDKVEKDSAGHAEKRKIMRTAFEDLSESFEERYEQLIAIRQDFDQELAVAMEDKFNEFIAEQPKESYAERKELADRINAMVRGVGLGIQWPDSGFVGTLVAGNEEEDHPEKTKWRFSVRAESSGGRPKGLSIHQPLPSLKLIPDDPEKRYRFKWNEQDAGELGRD